MLEENVQVDEVYNQSEKRSCAMDMDTVSLL